MTSFHDESECQTEVRINGGGVYGYTRMSKYPLPQIPHSLPRDYPFEPMLQNERNSFEIGEVTFKPIFICLARRG